MDRKPVHPSCRMDLYAAIRLYMERGWMALTQLFQHAGQRHGKEKTLAHQDVRRQYALALEMLGGIRKFAVDELFACVNRGRANTYVAFGSTNITSDYDLTIKGPDAPDVMWRMFQKFWKQHRNTLPRAFDSNIYCTGLYEPRGLRPAVRGRFQLVDGGATAVLAPLAEDAGVTLPAASMKLLQTPLALGRFPRLKKVVEVAAGWKAQLDDELARDVRRFHDQHADASVASCEVAAKYHLQYLRGRRLLREVYSAKSDGVTLRQFLRTACEANYFAMEAYYAPDTVNVVVMGLQKGERNLQLPAASYACALLENVGDLRTHALHELGARRAGSPRSLLLKYSKYVYRALFCAEQLLRRTRGKKAARLGMSARRVKKEVVAHRGSSAGVAEADFSAMNFEGGSVRRYVDRVTAELLAVVEAWLATR